MRSIAFSAYFSNYCSFGSLMPSRNGNANQYRYSINGQEKTDEISGSGNHTTALYWEYDTRLGRRWNLDPVDQVSVSRYSTFLNNPIQFTDVLGNKPSTDVTKNKDGSYTVAGAHNDGDVNIYVVGDDGKRTGEVIGTTVQPYDFMYTNDRTGEFVNDPNFGGQGKLTFRMDNLKVSGTVKPSEHVTETLNPADFDKFYDWAKGVFYDEWQRKGYGESLSAAYLLAWMSGNYNPKDAKDGKGSLDFKASFGMHQYSPLRVGGEGSTKMIPLRAAGNIVFGSNMRVIKPIGPFAPGYASWYNTLMPFVGDYNQEHNDGNGYNPGFPYYGENTYSGSYIYYGYFSEFPKK